MATEAEIEERIRLKAIELVGAAEKALLAWQSKFDAFLTFDEQDYRDTRDNVERCLSMVYSQLQEAWIHAGRAKKRLEKLASQAEASSPAQPQEG